MLTRSGGAPTRVLLLVTALLALVGGVLLALGLAGPPPTPADAVRPLPADGTVQVGDEGFSLWSTEATAFEDATCDADGLPLLRPSAPWSITVAGTDYHEVARSPRALLEGSYTVTCTPEQSLYAGPHAERSAPSPLRGPLGVLAGAVLLGLALVVGVVALVLHRRQKKLESFRVPAHRLDPSLRPAEATDEAGGQAPEEGRTAADAPASEGRRPRRGRRRERRAGDGE